MNQFKKVFTNQAANGVSDTFRFLGNLNGKDSLILIVKGNLGGGSITIQANDPDNTWNTIDGISITAEGVYPLDLPSIAGRLELLGATTPDVTVWVGNSKAAFLHVRDYEEV